MYLSFILAGEQPELALGLSGVFGLQSVSATTQQLLRQKQGNLLQTGLFQVRSGFIPAEMLGLFNYMYFLTALIFKWLGNVRFIKTKRRLIKFK